MLFAFIVTFIAIAVAVNMIKKADRDDDTRLHRQLEAAEARKILDARARQNRDRFETLELRVVGTSFRQDAIMTFAEPNEGYGRSKRDRVEEDNDGDREYQYTFRVSSAQLVPEPENPHDPNAIRVDFDGTTVGYIQRSDCQKVRQLLDSGRIQSITPQIFGGKFKELALDPNFDSDKDPRFSDWEIINDETEIGARVTIKAMREDAGSKHCPHCGAAVADAAAFCSDCGAKL